MTVTFIDSSSPGTQQSRSEIVTALGTGSGSVAAPALNAMAGWVAKGWTTSTAPDAAAAYIPGSAISVSGDVTYYGIYEKPVTYTFDAKGGTPTPEPITVAYKLNSASGTPVSPPPITMPPAPSRVGYTFGSWEDGDGYRYLPSETALPTNTSLRAIWTTVFPIP